MLRVSPLGFQYFPTAVITRPVAKIQFSMITARSLIIIITNTLIVKAVYSRYYPGGSACVSSIQRTLLVYMCARSSIPALYPR